MNSDGTFDLGGWLGEHISELPLVLYPLEDIVPYILISLGVGMFALGLNLVAQRFWTGGRHFKWFYNVLRLYFFVVGFKIIFDTTKITDFYGFPSYSYLIKANLAVLILLLMFGGRTGSSVEIHRRLIGR